MFVFHSDFWFNLHDFLYWRAQRGGPTDGGECVASQPATLADALASAEAFYAAEMAGRNPRTDDLMRTLRFGFAALASDEERVAESDSIVVMLRDVAPVYAACWWAEHDARNRAWITALRDLLDRHGATIAGQLNDLYVDPWPTTVPVDIVGYSNWAGANTTGEPVHMLVSAVDPDNLGLGSLEIVFHEASHGVFGASSGTITRIIREAFEARQKEPHPDLWHAILFYTSGKITQRALADAAIADYELYMYRGGVFEEHHASLERHWQPYVEGSIDLQTAAANLASSDR